MEKKKSDRLMGAGEVVIGRPYRHLRGGERERDFTPRSHPADQKTGPCTGPDGFAALLSLAASSASASPGVRLSRAA